MVDEKLNVVFSTRKISIMKKLLLFCILSSSVAMGMEMPYDPAEACLHNDFFSAIKKGDMREATSLLEECRIDPNIQDQHKRTPLMYAVLRRDETLVNFLLEYGADQYLCDTAGYNAQRMAFERDCCGMIAIFKAFSYRDATNFRYKQTQKYAKNRQDSLRYLEDNTH